MPDHAIPQDFVTAVNGKLSNIEGYMGKIAEAMTRLAILEERHIVVAQAVTKVADRQEKVEERVRLVEIEQLKSATTTKTSIGAVKVFWSLFGGIVVAGLTALFTLALKAS